MNGTGSLSEAENEHSLTIFFYTTPVGLLVDYFHPANIRWFLFAKVHYLSLSVKDVINYVFIIW